MLVHAASARAADQSEMPIPARQLAAWYTGHLASAGYLCKRLFLDARILLCVFVCVGPSVRVRDCVSFCLRVCLCVWVGAYVFDQRRAGEKRHCCATPRLLHMDEGVEAQVGGRVGGV